MTALARYEKGKGEGRNRPSLSFSLSVQPTNTHHTRSTRRLQLFTLNQRQPQQEGENKAGVFRSVHSSSRPPSFSFPLPPLAPRPFSLCFSLSLPSPPPHPPRMTMVRTIQHGSAGTHTCPPPTFNPRQATHPTSSLTAASFSFFLFWGKTPKPAPPTNNHCLPLLCVASLLWLMLFGA